MVKVKVKPEGREGIYLATPAQACKFIDQLGYKHIHNFLANDDSSMIIGADWSVKSVKELLNKKGVRIAFITSNEGVFANHRLVVVDGYDRNIFDIGEITDEDFEINPLNERKIT